MLFRIELVIRHGHQGCVLSLLKAQNADPVFCPEVYLPDALSHPFLGYRDLEDGILVVELDIVKDMVRTVADCRFLRNVPIRIDHLVCAVAQQELGLNIPGRLAHHVFCPVFLEQGGNFQTALKVRPDTHKADIKVADPDTL